MRSPVLTALFLTLAACGADGAGDTPDAGSGADAGPTDCEGPDFLHAPPPSEAFGIERVFVDVLSVHGVAHLDAATQQASARATMRFRMGNDGGNPTFDLRQVITRATLDGEELDDPDFQLRRRGFETGTLRAAEARLEPCTEHELYLEYELADPLPDVNGGEPPIWGAGWVEWGLKLYDVWQGRLLEQWFPVGLMNDRFDFELEVELAGVTEEHLLISNGEVAELGAGHWRVVYPSHFTSQSPMAEVVPAARVTALDRAVTLPGDQTITLELYQHADVAADLETLATNLSDALIEFTTSDGPYLHGDRFTALVLVEDYEAEEYEGATTTHQGRTITRHEVYHSWFGRGVSPATFNDSWFDEAWVTYVTDPPAQPLAATDEPVALDPGDPWLRELESRAYTDGAAMFLALAGDLGAAELAGYMKAFVQDNALAQVTTDDLRRHLYCSSGDDAVLFWFHRFVYGRDGDPPAAPDGYCD